MFHLPARLDECTETTEGSLEPRREPGFTGPIWNDFREPEGVLNSAGVGISARRLLAELVVEPPKDGPSYGSFPTGNAINPAPCAADPATDDFLTDLTESGFFTDPAFTDSALVKYRLGTPLPDSDFALSFLTDPAFTDSGFTGMATALPTEKDLADPPGSDLGRCA